MKREVVMVGYEQMADWQQKQVEDDLKDVIWY
jgi:hypothetical protein